MDTVKTDPDAQFEVGECFRLRRLRHDGSNKALNEGAELGKAGPEKLQRRATARKIGKMIRRCKAETKALKKLDDEQIDYLERMRKRF